MCVVLTGVHEVLRWCLVHNLARKVCSLQGHEDLDQELPALGVNESHDGCGNARTDVRALVLEARQSNLPGHAFHYHHLVPALELEVLA